MMLMNTTYIRIMQCILKKKPFLKKKKNNKKSKTKKQKKNQKNKNTSQVCSAPNEQFKESNRLAS